ncbi:alpha/beta fold hydrolase [Ancylobacter sp. VNQ12]|uniref:alpha/beta fold hydrolase n=1 Tax=Ancylobacter sp. VNQ12 TaxID=3400920 RepID=UPI003C051502
MNMQTRTDTTEVGIVHDAFTTLLRCSGSPTLPATVLIHGSGPGAVCRSNWQYLIPELGGRFHCLAMGLCSYGGSPVPDAMPKKIADFFDSRI